MKLKFLKANYGIDFKIPEEKFIKTLKDVFSNSEKNNLAIYSAVQFRNFIPKVKEIIKKEGFSSETSKPYRTSLEGQILGCDSYKDSLNLNLDEVDGFLYIGDGYFHPNALLLAQENEKEIKPVILINIVQQIIEVIDKSHIEKYLKKRKAIFTKFFISKVIGVFITTKWGQSYEKAALKLKEKYPEKEFYFFIGDNFNDLEMENFPWVECWVNTACPRIGQDDVLRHKKPVINIKDIF
jgi:diphthamide biosynthesis enzyme Dph1/Dph2-like protein